MQPENTNGIKTWQWVVTVIVIIVLIVIGVLVFGNKGTPGPAATTDNSSTSGVAPSTAINRIVMSDQYPGNIVYLSSVQLAQPGWVVIQSDNNGQPGAIIGETYFAAGINPGKVTVSAPLIDGSTYYAVIYSDNGDQKFDPTVDLPLKDSSGNIIMHVFQASSSVGNSLKG